MKILMPSTLASVRPGESTRETSSYLMSNSVKGALQSTDKADSRPDVDLSPHFWLEGLIHLVQKRLQYTG